MLMVDRSSNHSRNDIKSASWRPSNGDNPLIDDVYSRRKNSRVFAYSSSVSTLYDAGTSPLSMQVSTLPGVNAQNVLGIKSEGQRLLPFYLYLVVGGAQNNFDRITLSNNQISGQEGINVQLVELAFVGVPRKPVSDRSFWFNANQTVAQSATPLPLKAQVLDLTGRPIFNLPVNFTTDANNGIVITTPNPTTNADGFVQTTIVAPAVQGTYTVTLTAGTANTTFTITVPGAGGSGGTGPGGISQVTIATENGQVGTSGNLDVKVSVERIDEGAGYGCQRRAALWCRS